MGKPRVYEVAKELNISSVALLEVIRSFGIEVKSHMSTVDRDVVDKVRKKFEKEKAAVKEEYARKMEKRAARLETEAKERAAKVVVKPPEKKLRARMPRKKKRVVDEKAVRESVKRTLAGMDVSKARRRRRREEGEAVVVEEPKLIKVSEYLTVAELATRMGCKPSEVVAACLELGLMVNVNKRLDRDSIITVADEFGYAVEFVSEYGSSLLKKLRRRKRLF